MTNEIVTTNTQNVAPWVGVGTQGSWNSVEQAMNECGLNFTVQKKDALFNYSDNGIEYYDKIPGAQATVRVDTNEALGCVSDTYTPIQNLEVFSMLEPFVESGGLITSGGMTEDGLCFMVLDTGKMNFGGDNYQVNIMATNSFNGKYPAAIICSPVRIICQNMYRHLMGNKDNIARCRHSLNIESKLAAIQEATKVFANFKESFGNQVEHLKQLQAAHSIDEFVEYMFPYSNDKDAELLSQRALNARDRVDERRNHYINTYYNSSTNSDFGTCFALVNAYYDYMSHSMPTTKTDENYRSRRLSNIVGGQAASLNLIQYMCESK